MAANTIVTQKLIDSQTRSLIKFDYISDGTNSSNNVLIDVSSLNYSLNANGYIMTADVHQKSNYRTTIRRIFGNAKLTGHVKLGWHGDANSAIVRFGTGIFDYNFEEMGRGGSINNPEANTGGDILISTIDSAANDMFTLFVDLRKDNRDYDAGQTNDPVAFNRGPATW